VCPKTVQEGLRSKVHGNAPEREREGGKILYCSGREGCKYPIRDYYIGVWEVENVI